MILEDFGAKNFLVYFPRIFPLLTSPPKTQKFAHVIVFFHEFNDKPLVIYPGLQDGGGKGTTKLYYVSLEKSTNLKLSN